MDEITFSNQIQIKSTLMNTPEKGFLVNSTIE